MLQECRSDDVFCVASEISHTGKVFLFFFSVVVPLTKGLELLRFVAEVYLKFFFF